MEWYVIVSIVLSVLYVILIVVQLRFKVKYEDLLFENEVIKEQHSDLENYLYDNYHYILRNWKIEYQDKKRNGEGTMSFYLMNYKLFENDMFNRSMNIDILDYYTTEQLQQELEERKLKQNYPLAYEIKHLDCEFVELYEDGKFKDKYTKVYAWEYVKKYGKDKNIVYKAIK